MSVRAWARSTAAAALSGLAIVASVDRASASLSSTAGPASATYSTGTLAAPTGAAAARGACTILTSSTVVVTWTQTTSTFADCPTSSMIRTLAVSGTFCSVTRECASIEAAISPTALLLLPDT